MQHAAVRSEITALGCDPDITRVFVKDDKRYANEHAHKDTKEGKAADTSIPAALLLEDDPEEEGVSLSQRGTDDDSTVDGAHGKAPKSM